jgi:hypothetical protein
MFAKWLVEPRLGRWRSMFNAQLLPLFGTDVARRYELDYESPVPENSDQALAEIETKTAAFMLLVQGGCDSKEAADYLGLPDLGYEKPEPAPIRVPATLGEPVREIEPADASIEGAMRWEVIGEDDDNACDPCLKNHGKLYRNRQSAYADYPGGNGYIKCVGAQYGNKCRCSVKRRRKS